MGYTREQILEQCRKAFQNKNTFYKKEFINYRGKTTDTREYYTEVIAEFLCDNITDYINGIDCITRKSSYKTNGHDGQYDADSNREEEKIAMRFFLQSRDYGAFSLIGQIEDYQTPLKSSADDEAGKIDLLSCDGKIMRILELKKPDSKETMLRCVLEGYTYLKTANNDRLITDFGYNPEEVKLKASPFVFYGGEQHKEMKQPRPQLRKLMKILDK
ncbi:MAG: hypothetical protein K2N89_08385 [Lachnospiraceae bacterium]|nr:hypothetical protein [Lachnospiraceae bacterium]